MRERDHGELEFAVVRSILAPAKIFRFCLAEREKETKGSK